MWDSNERNESGRLRSFGRLDRFFVGYLLIGHSGLLQDSIYDLFFQYNRTDFVQLGLFLKYQATTCSGSW